MNRLQDTRARQLQMKSVVNDTSVADQYLMTPGSVPVVGLEKQMEEPKISENARFAWRNRKFKVWSENLFQVLSNKFCHFKHSNFWFAEDGF